MNKIKYNPFSKIMQAFERNKFFKKVLFFTINIGFEDFVFRTINKKFLKERQEFYLERKKQVEENISWLADEISKDVYKMAITYRCKRFRKDFPEYCIENQYFPEDIIKLSSEDVFVDCGAYIGDTIEKFMEVSEGNYKAIIGFEPDETNFSILKSNINDKKNVFVYNNAVDSECKDVMFDGGNKDSSKISESGNSKIKAINLESIKECEDATFIKMDIEGFEPEALKGAESILRKNKPKLAICIYHSDDDMINIIQYIHKIVPEYKIYIRHHAIYETETVMYAVI